MILISDPEILQVFPVFFLVIEIAKLYNVPFEPDAAVMEPKGEEAVEYSTSQGVPLIDFGAGAVGPPPLPVQRPIGFDLPNEKGATSATPAPLQPLRPGTSNEKNGLLDSSNQPEPPPKNPSPPPNYDSIIHNPPTNRPTPKPRTTVNSDEFPELPNVPHGTPQHMPTKPADNDEDGIDFDDLAKRFEALKKKK
jgi:hypothetical protein